MQYDTQDAFLADAFAVVRKYDPETYARMTRDKWLVSTSYYDALAGAYDKGIHAYPATDPGYADIASHAFGATLSDANPYLELDQARVFINRQAIRSWAYAHSVSVPAFTAAVLVHEYKHTHEADMKERDAFEAGSAFAAKLPGRDGLAIKRMSDRNAAHLVNDQYA